MTRGLIKILFDYGGSHTIEITAPDRQSLQDYKQWEQIKTWWVFGSSDTCRVTWADDSELLLSGSKVVCISMSPVEILEVTI